MSESGEFKKASFGNEFTQTLDNKDLVLQAGEYVFMVDPIWNNSTKLSPSYREILIDIYGPESVTISEMSKAKGFKVLENSLKHAALTKSQTKHIKPVQ